MSMSEGLSAKRNNRARERQDARTGRIILPGKPVVPPPGMLLGRVDEAGGIAAGDTGTVYIETYNGTSFSDTLRDVEARNMGPADAAEDDYVLVAEVAGHYFFSKGAAATGGETGIDGICYVCSMHATTNYEGDYDLHSWEDTGGSIGIRETYLHLDSPYGAGDKLHALSVAADLVLDYTLGGSNGDSVTLQLTAIEDDFDVSTLTYDDAASLSGEAIGKIVLVDTGSNPSGEIAFSGVAGGPLTAAATVYGLRLGWVIDGTRDDMPVQNPWGPTAIPLSNFKVT
jgi:hypothetical protein